MAVTTAKLFGDFVIDGDGATVEGMTDGGATPPAEFASNPLLDPSLRLAAARTYADYLRGFYGTPGSVADEMFAHHASDMAKNGVLAHQSHGDQRAGWDANRTFQAAFTDACKEAFAVYKQ